MRFRQPPRAAFTLLEVILALALSALLLGALAVAIQVSLKATYSGRTDVAEAQLARAALQRIGNDVRAAIWYEPPDPASMVVPPSVASLTSSSSSGGSGGSGGSQGSSQSASSSSSSSNSSSSRGGGSGGGGSSGGGGTSTSSSSMGGGSTTGGGSSGGSGRSGGGGGGSSSGGGSGGGGGSGSGSGSSSSSSSSTTTTQMPMPMFVGGQNWLQVDVSHVPRPDQYAFMQYSGGSSSGGSSSGGASAASGSAANVATTGRDRVSETKTVYYFLAGGAGQALPPGLSAGAVGGGQQGLMRREADRAVTAWSSYGGGSSGVGPALEALAPEIASLNFSYFNGSSWSNSWDSRIYYCLPRAVEIRITLVDELDKRDAAGRASTKRPAGQTRNQAPLKEYVLRVPIPAWRPPNLQLLNSMANSTASGAGSSGSSSSGGAGGMGSY